MILSDRDLRAEIEAGRLSISPFDPSSIQPSSIDVRVGEQFRVFANHRYPHIDVRQPMDHLTDLVEASEEDPFILHPGEFVLGTTQETVTLPDNLVARLEGKSSLGRLGLLIHSSLPGSEPVLFLHDGFLDQVPIEDIVRKQLHGSVVSFDPESFEIVYRDVTGWHETPADRIFEVSLASGRRVRLTGGHVLFTLGSGTGIDRARVQQLGAGARVAIAGDIPDPPGRDPVLDLIALAPEHAYGLLACGGPNVAAAFRSWPRELAALLRDAGIGRMGHYRERAVLPLDVALQHPGLAATLGPGDWLSARRGRHRIPALLQVDEDLAWLLGLYVAVGTRRVKQIAISTTDEEILDRVQLFLARNGFSSRRTSGAVTCRSGLLSQVVGWLGIGDDVAGRRLPHTLLGWPFPLLRSFLDGFLAGGLAAKPPTSATSSEGLTGDLLLLRARLPRGGDPRPPTAPSSQLERLVRGGVRWDPVVEVRDTGAVEPVFDLEVDRDGVPTQNFLAGHGGVFVSNTAGFVDAGFSGQLTLELSNVANLPIAIYPGMPIGQLCVFQMTSPAERPYGSQEAASKYQAQRGPTPSRFHENF